MNMQVTVENKSSIPDYKAVEFVSQLMLFDKQASENVDYFRRVTQLTFDYEEKWVEVRLVMPVPGYNYHEHKNRRYIVSDKD